MIKTRKQIKSETRIANKKTEKTKNRIQFLRKLAGRRGFIVESSPCQSGHQQIVSEVVPAGNAFFYKSCACAGCPQGSAYIAEQSKKPLTTVVPSEIKGCHLVRNNHLVSLVEIKVGQIVVAEAPNSIVSK